MLRLWCAEPEPHSVEHFKNSATLIVEEELQPFDMLGGKTKTKDMHLHRLPWPIDVLESLDQRRYGCE